MGNPFVREKGAAMSVTHANGTKVGSTVYSDGTAETSDDLSTKVGAMSARTEERAAELVERGKDVAHRRPVALVTAATAAGMAGVAVVVVAVVTVVRRRRAHPTPRQRAVNAWRRTSKSVKQRVKR